MATIWTILWQPPNGSWTTEATLTSYGFQQPRHRTQSQKSAVVNLRQAGAAMDGPALIPFLSTVIIRKNGAQWYVGLCSNTPGTGTGAAENRDYEVSDNWWHLEKNIYQQPWAFPVTGTGFAPGDVTVSGGVITACAITTPGTGYAQGTVVLFTGGSGVGAYGYLNVDSNGVPQSVTIVHGGVNYTSPTGTLGIPADGYSPHVFICPWIFNSAGYYTREDTRSQIGNIFSSFFPFIQSQTGFAIPIQIGNIPPSMAIDIPVDEQKNIPVAEVLRKIARWMPDATFWFDHTTTPPTLNMGRQADLTPVTLAISGGTINGAEIKNINVRALYENQIPVVSCIFEQANSINGGGQSSSQLYRTLVQYPTNISRFTPRGLSLTVSLQGSNQQNTTAQIVVGAVSSATTGSDIHADAWWLVKLPWLQNVDASYGATIESLQFIDANGNTYSSPQLANELLDGQYATWMQANTPFTAREHQVQAVIKCKLNNAQPSDGGFARNSGPTAEITKKTITFRYTATSAPVSSPAGTPQTFSTWSTYQTAEAIPTSLPQTLFAALSPLYYEGSITLQETEATGIVGVGQAVNLSGGDAAWSTMAMPVQTVDVNYETGQTTFTFGPAAHLGPTDLLTLLRLNRYLLDFVNPSAQISAQVPTSQVALGAQFPKSDATAQTTTYYQFGAQADVTPGNSTTAPTIAGGATPTSSSVGTGGGLASTVPPVPAPSGGGPSGTDDPAKGLGVLRGATLSLGPVPANASLPGGINANAATTDANAWRCSRTCDQIGSDGNYHPIWTQEMTVCVLVEGVWTQMSVMGDFSAPFTPG